MKPLAVLIVLAFCSIFVGIGLLITWQGCRKLARALAATSWATAEGKILESRLDVDNSGDSTTYQAAVRYSYRVNDHVYIGKRLHHVHDGGGQGAHRALVAKLPAGTRVQVRYDPANPAESTLTAGFTRGALPSVFGGLLFACFGAVFGLIALASAGEKSELADRLVILEKSTAR